MEEREERKEETEGGREGAYVVAQPEDTGMAPC